MGLVRRFWFYVAQKVRPFFDIDMNGKKISGLPDPTEDNEVPNKKYVDNKIDGDMLKSTYDTEESGIVKDSEKLEGKSKAQVRDHPVKGHALSSHSDPSNDVNMGGRHITHIGEPTQDQDIVTKKYVDDLFGELTPADIPLIAYPWSPAYDEKTIKSQFSTLKSLGLNAFEGGWDKERWLEKWDKGVGIEVVLDRVYNLAEEYGIKVYWMTSIHRLEWKNPDTDPPNQTFVGRYKNFPACAGWDYCDEPALKGIPYEDYQYEGEWVMGCKSAIDWIHSEDPAHPAIPVWSADLDTTNYMRTMHPGWGDLYDLSCTDIYPESRSDTPSKFLAHKCYLTYNYTEESPYWGFKHWQPRNHIAVIQAFKGTTRPVLPDIINQYNILKDGYERPGEDDWVGWGDKLQGIGFYTPSAYLFASGDDAEDIRNQIKALARLRGWGG